MVITKTHRPCNSPALWSTTPVMRSSGEIAKPRATSLATRLFVSATAWVVVILLLTGIVLSSVYRQAPGRPLARGPNRCWRPWGADVPPPDGPPDRQFQSLGEPLFELPLSGWYW